MKKNKVTKKDILFLSISFFVVVVCWIGFSVYHAFVTSTISEDLQMTIAPIEGKFDTSVLDKLKTREKISPIFTKSETVVASPAAEEELFEEEITPTIEPSITPPAQTTIDETTIIETIP